MKISFENGGVLISETMDFDVARSCECGQCFRFFEKDGDYVGVVQNKVITLSPRADGCFIPDVSKEYFEAVFRKSGETDLSRTLMVGDNPVTDVNGAVDFGMTGALFGARWQEPSKARYVARTMEELENLLFEGLE